MLHHVAIRRPEFNPGTYAYPKIPVLTQTNRASRPVPCGRLKIGDTVWMKWSGGPVVARATVRDFRDLGRCTPEELRESTRGYDLYDVVAYWVGLPPEFFGMTIYLEKEEWVERPFIPRTRSHGASWIVLDSPKLEQEWLGQENADYDTKGSPLHSPFVKFAVFRRDHFTCTRCLGRAPFLELCLEYRGSVQRGGDGTIDDFCTVCVDCRRR
ncbi:hypothetical protein HRbin30_01539 [bacterium HR30]|nr:hypothetical protein HRbin30_01539 [bacterium HR30]